MINISPVGKGCKQSRNHLKREKEKKQKKTMAKNFMEAELSQSAVKILH